MRNIFISAGHSNADPGAVNGSVTEAHIVTDFRNMVAHYLREAGVQFASDGDGNDNKPLAQAVKLIKRGDLAVEFHCNASSNPTATGVETLSGPKDKTIGAAICQTIAETLNIRNRGAKDEGSGQHSRLAFVQAGGIIVELFFISNPTELRAYLDKKWLVARAVAKKLLELAK